MMTIDIMVNLVDFVYQVICLSEPSLAVVSVDYWYAVLIKDLIED